MLLVMVSENNTDIKNLMKLLKFSKKVIIL